MKTENFTWEVFIKGESIGTSDTDGRHDLIQAWLKENSIKLEDFQEFIKAGDVEHRLIST